MRFDRFSFNIGNSTQLIKGVSLPPSGTCQMTFVTCNMCTSMFVTDNRKRSVSFTFNVNVTNVKTIKTIKTKIKVTKCLTQKSLDT